MVTKGVIASTTGHLNDHSINEHSTLLVSLDLSLHSSFLIDLAVLTIRKTQTFINWE